MTTNIQLPNSSSAADPTVSKEASDPKKTIGFYEVVPRDDLICSISNELMTSAITLEKCGHVFNKKSIKMCYAGKPENEKCCPVCSAVAPTYTPNRFIRNIIDSLKKHPLWNEKAFYESLVETPTAAAPDSEQEVKDKIAAIVSDWRRGGHTSEAAIDLLYGLASEFPKSKDACEEAVSQLLKEMNPEAKPKQKIHNILPFLSQLPFGLPSGLKLMPHIGKEREHISGIAPTKAIHVYDSDEDVD